MITLRNKQTGTNIGEITEEDLGFLQSQMVEDRPDDHDYYINASELQIFEESGASPALIQTLRQALDANGELDIEWD